MRVISDYLYDMDMGLILMIPLFDILVTGKMIFLMVMEFRSLEMEILNMKESGNRDTVMVMGFCILKEMENL